MIIFDFLWIWGETNLKIALVDDEQNYLDEMAGLVCDFGTQRHCHMETVPFLNAEGRKTIQVFLDEISSVITDAHYLDIALSNGETLHCRMTMPEFVMLTDGDSRFLAINKGIMVNADCILEFTDNCCVLENGAKLPIRVRDRLKIEQAARDYNFRKIRKRPAHFAGRPVPEDIRKGD